MSHHCILNQSCHLKMSHVTPSHVTWKWVMSHLNESCHAWMSHGTYQFCMLHMNESCHIWVRQRYGCCCAPGIGAQVFIAVWMSHVTHKWVMSHMNESCHNESCHTWARQSYECCRNAMLRYSSRHPLVSHFIHTRIMSHMDEWCHVTHEWVMLQWVMLQWVMSHVSSRQSDERCRNAVLKHSSRYSLVISFINELCRTWMSHVMSHMNESCHVWMGHVTYGWSHHK